MFRRFPAAATAALLVVSFAAAAPAQTIDHHAFRRIFAGVLASGGRSTDEIEKLVFYPSPQLLHGPRQFRSGEEFFDLETRQMSQIDPTVLYRIGRKVPLNPVPYDAIRTTLRSPGPGVLDRLTIVVVPGVLGEFIKTRAFEDVL